MTEAEWHDAADPGRMLVWLRDRDRVAGWKATQFACGCCRRVWHRLPDQRSRHAVEVVERYLDGEATDMMVEVAIRDAEAAERARRVLEREATGERAVLTTTLFRSWLPDSWPCVAAVVTNTWLAAGHAAKVKICDSEGAAQAELIRCVFGNPFRPVAFAPEWRTSAAVGMADAMYQSRDFGPMPVLADALEEAGCDNADILSHCRGDGPHVRGCWVVDLVLGKA